MQDVGKLLLSAGLGIAAIGAVLWLLGRFGFRGLPGDIAYEGERFRFYFPIVSSIALSAILTLGFWLWQHFTRK